MSDEINFFNDHEIEPLDQTKTIFLNYRFSHLVKSLMQRNIENNGVYYEYDEFDESFNPIKNTEGALRLASEMIFPYALWVTNIYIKNFYGYDLNLFNFNKVTEGDSEILTVEYNQNTESHITIIYLFLVVAFIDKFNSNRKQRLVINTLSNLIK